MRFGREGGVTYIHWRGPEGDDFGILGLAVRFVVNVAALWLAQLIIPGFYINGWSALIFGAIIFGTVNAFIKPMLLMFSCLLNCLTLGLFTFIVNTAMLGLTAWIAGWFDLAFHVDGFFAAFFGALVISIVGTLLGTWADSNILRPSREGRDDW